jgi:hypothetical protein
MAFKVIEYVALRTSQAVGAIRLYLANKTRTWRGGQQSAGPITPAANASLSGQIALPVPTDFLGSARRHMQDALMLESANRKANSGQLLGFTAECGVKAVMVWLGYPTDASGSPHNIRGAPHNLRAHVDAISGRLVAIESFVLSISGRSGSAYLALIPSINHFSSWSVDHRYYREASIPNSFADWKTAALEVMAMLDQATKDGMS